MIRRSFFLIFLIFFIFFDLSAQDREGGNHPYILRGEVYIDLEPIYAGHIDDDYPLDIPAAARRALEETAFLFSAMIYGWSFHYDIGENARRIAENLEIEPVAMIQAGDPGLKVTETELKEMRLKIWTDYHLNDIQQRSMKIWRTGRIRNAQAVGYDKSPVGEYPGWLEVKKSALEDAARIALRTMLRSSERNRPKEVTGFISLATFPRFFIESGRWAASARFRVQIIEINSFSAY